MRRLTSRFSGRFSNSALARQALLIAFVLLVLPMAGCHPVPGAPNCPVLPDDNAWHADVSKLPVNSRSAQWLASTNAATTKLHPDFGGPYGIPYTVVAGTHPKVPVAFDYADESDRVAYPLGSDTKIEGGSDRHALVLDRDSCKLYETWNTTRLPNGSWHAGSGAVFDLRSNNLRPAGWTSADAAGLPILPGLLRLDEVKSGQVDHAIRFTVARTDRSYVWPARHQAGAANDAALPPMGARFRLKANYSLAGLRPDTQVVLKALQTYGLIVADNGSNWFFQGATDPGWPSAMLDELKRVPASAFEAVDASKLMITPNSGQARKP